MDSGLLNTTENVGGSASAAARKADSTFAGVNKVDDYNIAVASRQEESKTRKMPENSDVCFKAGYLQKQTSSFQRWHRRYFKLRDNSLLYGKSDKVGTLEEISLEKVTVAEHTSKTAANTFQVITQDKTLVLSAETRGEMAEWMTAIQHASGGFQETGDHHGVSHNTTGGHVWFSTTHAMPTYCNVCREQLCGMMSSGLSCEVCKFKAHKQCAAKAPSNCKWTTLCSMGKENLQESEGSLIFPHQWIEGNFLKAKCAVCEKNCGSVLKLQDWRCVWCRGAVHNTCKHQMRKRCSANRISVVPPTALTTVGNDEAWEAGLPLHGCSPLLVFVNSKSGDHQGLKFLRRFKQLLNPAQVFDLVNGGPRPGLQLFRHFEPFRILVCGGDGSVGWVMCEIDSLDMHRQVQVGVLPLGTGNDLARVLGWGASCDDEANLPHLLDKYEKATTKMLDRWSIMTYERGCVIKPSVAELVRQDEKPGIAQLEDSVVCHLENIMDSEQPDSVISSAKVLCEAVRDMIGKIGSSTNDSEINIKCANLSQKLSSLLLTLNEETDCDIPTDCDLDVREMVAVLVTSTEDLKTEEVKEEAAVEEAVVPSLPVAIVKPSSFHKREALMSRANSLKKAVRQIIEHAEKTIDEQSGSPPVMVVRPLTLSVKAEEEQTVTLSCTDDCGGGRGDSRRESDVKLLHVSGMSSPMKTAVVQELTLAVMQQGDVRDGRKLSSHGGAEEGDESSVAEASVAGDLEDFPRIEVQSPSSSSNDKTPEDKKGGGGGAAFLSAPTGKHIDVVMTPDLHHFQPPEPLSLDNLVVPDGVNFFGRGQSPRASRRVSMGSLLKPLEVEIPSPNSRKNSSGHYGDALSDYYGLSNSPFSGSSSMSSSPNKGSDGKKRTMPIINPLVLHPSWPSVTAGGVIGKVLMANADAMCAVASPLMDPEASEELLMQGFRERAVMNNYFGIGLDAKITLDFHLKREEHPEKFKSRGKNFMWYGVLGSKEMLQRTCKNLDQRVKLECDGVRIPLPRLQGIVICNIPSFMGGTNFWGMYKDDGFLHSNFDDGIIEVMAVFHTVQMATSRVVNFYQHRIAQCTRVTITILGDDPIPVQVDGEAWLQPPGVIQIVLKNRMPMLCRNRKLESNLKTWEEKLKAMNATAEEPDFNKEKRRSRGSIFGRLTRKGRDEGNSDTNPDGCSEETGSESKPVQSWNAEEVAHWLDQIHMSEYKTNFVRHDIQGAELLSLQRRDLKELGVTKVGHLKRILQQIEALRKEHKLTP